MIKNVTERVRQLAMEYVVVDFEWNQSPYGKNASNKRLPFEIIEIGAVKLDEEGREIDRFSEMIKPKVYRKMNHVTKNLTGITEKDLNRGTVFPKVLVDFMLWCGEVLSLIPTEKDETATLFTKNMTLTFFSRKKKKAPDCVIKC